MILLFFLVFFIFNQSTKTYENMTSGVTYTGGCTASNDIYTFTTSGTFTVANDTTVNVLLVGGGGGGGSADRGDDGTFNAEGAGGGGGGGVGYGSITLQAGTYNITIGNGGASGVIGGNNTGTTGSNGGNTTITGGNMNETAYGGGGGGSDSLIATSGLNGGSGGGNCAGWGRSGTGSATKGRGNLTYYGNNGGVGIQNGGGGGGGGAGGEGQSAVGWVGIGPGPGNGGSGWSCPINGQNYGGGGGGGWFGIGKKDTLGLGGCCWGGNGGYNSSSMSSGFVAGGNGTPNSGSGGGGGSNNTAGGTGGNGVVIFQITSMKQPLSQCTYSSTQSPCSATVCGTSGTSTTTWTQTSPSPCSGSIPAQTTQSCTAPACPLPQSPNYTANYNIYTVVDNIPVTLQKNMRLSCVSDDCKQNSKCMDIKLGKNMAISFQINLNKANSSNNRQQIFGITTDPCGTDKRVFGAWLDQNGIYLDTSIINPETGTDYSTSNNILTLTNFQATISQNIRVDVLCNFNQQTHEIYVNGSLTATKTVYQNPYFTNGSAYIFSSFNEFQNVDGSIHDLVFLTSDIRTFKIEDLTGASTFVDTNLRGIESFQNIYTQQPDGSYSAEDLRGMQTELLQEINNFNQGYSNYMKYMFNQRHNQTGDTTEKMALYDLCGNKITDSDFAQSNTMNLYANLPESQTYNNLINDLAVFNQAIKYNSIDMSYNITKIDTDTMMAAENELINYRSNLDEKLAELNETETSMFAQNNRNMKSQTFKTVLLTTLATSLVYYVFIHSE